MLPPALVAPPPEPEAILPPELVAPPPAPAPMLPPALVAPPPPAEQPPFPTVLGLVAEFGFAAPVTPPVLEPVPVPPVAPPDALPAPLAPAARPAVALAVRKSAVTIDRVTSSLITYSLAFLAPWLSNVPAQNLFPSNDACRANPLFRRHVLPTRPASRRPPGFVEHRWARGIRPSDRFGSRDQCTTAIGPSRASDRRCASIDYLEYLASGCALPRCAPLLRGRLQPADTPCPFPDLNVVAVH